jgi:protein tyrosine phosphatase (PTP) superfamily phosphohydrolase (DUF442 family)
LAWATLLLMASGGCGRDGGGPATPATQPSRPELGKVEAPGLHNVFRLTEKLYSGSSPEGDEGFESLQKLGIKTIISVDGARPDVERAHKFGMRYVHLPIGYDGVPEEQGKRIAKAVRDLPGAVYIHCHHGQHRGPAAAAVAHLCVDEKCSVQAALEGLRRAGTDPHYAGLYAAPKELRRPSKEELDRLPDDFPEVAAVPDLAQIMVGVDERWDRIKQVRAAGWSVPPGHPDVDPPHESLQLVEQYREALRLPKMKERPEEFRRWLTEARDAAEGLEAALRPRKGQGVDAAAAEAAFKAAGAACTRCHARYRDVRRR